MLQAQELFWNATCGTNANGSMILHSVGGGRRVLGGPWSTLKKLESKLRTSQLNCVCPVTLTPLLCNMLVKFISLNMVAFREKSCLIFVYKIL